jgi:hypothetical protein
LISSVTIEREEFRGRCPICIQEHLIVLSAPAKILRHQWCKTTKWPNAPGISGRRFEADSSTSAWRMQFIQWA